jgi:hypothetical protein
MHFARLERIGLTKGVARCSDGPSTVSGEWWSAATQRCSCRSRRRGVRGWAMSRIQETRGSTHGGVHHREQGRQRNFEVVSDTQKRSNGLAEVRWLPSGWSGSCVEEKGTREKLGGVFRDPGSVRDGVREKGSVEGGGSGGA